MKEINYNELKEEVTKKMKSLKEVVVSTSYKDHVTSRTVYCFYENESLYFITSKAYTKFKQIQKNLNIAACYANMQLEGIAEIVGHPKEIKMKIEDEETKNYIESYSKYKNTVLIKIKPLKITLYKSPGLYQYLDIVDGKAYSKGRN